MEITLKEKFILLAMNPEKGTNLIPTFIGHGIAGAILLELAGLKKVNIEDNRIIVTDSKRTGDEQLDLVLAYLKDAGKPLKVKTIINKFQGKASKIKKPLLAGLVNKRFLHRNEKRFLFFKYNLYPSANRKYRDDLIEHIRRLILRDIKSEDDIPLLAGLTGATQLFTKFFRDRKERKLARKRVKQIVKENEIEGAIDETVKAVQAAIAVSIATTAVVATASSH